MHPTLKKVKKNSITIENLEEFLVISFFYETKNPTDDMKAHAYSKFRKNRF
jgi:hypothetical protein